MSAITSRRQAAKAKKQQPPAEHGPGVAEVVEELVVAAQEEGRERTR